MTQSTQAAERSAGHAEPAAPGRCHICAGPLRNGGAAVALVPGTNAEGRTVPVMACACSAECAADERFRDPLAVVTREAERRGMERAIALIQRHRFKCEFHPVGRSRGVQMLSPRDFKDQAATAISAALAAPAGGETSDDR